MHVCALQKIEEARVVGSGRGEGSVRRLCRSEVVGEVIMGVPELRFSRV